MKVIESAMDKEFIIDNEHMMIEVSELRFVAEISDVSSVGSRWAESMYSGRKRVLIRGKKKNGEVVDQVYRLIGKNERDTLILESLTKLPVVGQGE